MEATNNSLKPAKYKWWKDKKMIGTIILILSVVLTIFAFVKVPFISSINAYTVGMMFGWYAPLFYAFTAYISLIMIFGDKVKLPKWFKLTPLTYWIVVILIMFLSVSTGYYQSKNGFTSFGAKPWKSFNDWFDNFTDNGNASSWTPDNTNGGVIGVFIYSFVSMIFSGIGALILSIASLFIVVSYMITGSTIGLYKDIMRKRKVELKQKEIESDKRLNIDNFSNSESKIEKEEQPDDIKKDKSLPFEDPF